MLFEPVALRKLMPTRAKMIVTGFMFDDRLEAAAST